MPLDLERAAMSCSLSTGVPFLLPILRFGRRRFWSLGGWLRETKAGTGVASTSSRFAGRRARTHKQELQK